MEFTTQTGSKWDTEKPVKTTMKVSNPKLTGKYEAHELGGETTVMVEVDHDFGTDMIFEEYVWQ